MNTKLVYVLTCAPEKTYIEQALMAVYSARHWNPDAHIVLITDNLTDALLTGSRGEILDYVSEKIVHQFPDTDSMMYRSRWLKTSVRSLIDGDFLFIDCDTLCQKSLNEVDELKCPIGAVYESHLPVSLFCDSLSRKAKAATSRIGVDLEEEKYYFSSGVLFVRDTKESRKLYELWHQFWIEGESIGLHIDQPSLAKANREVGHVIKKMPDTYNCILFTRNAFTRDAHILHVAAYMNPCLLFNDKALQYVKENGLKNNSWLTSSIINPCCTFLPFDYDIMCSTYHQRRIWRKERSSFLKGYGKYIDPSFECFQMKSRVRSLIVYFLQKGNTLFAISMWMLWRRMQITQNRKHISTNICSK